MRPSPTIVIRAWGNSAIRVRAGATCGLCTNSSRSRGSMCQARANSRSSRGRSASTGSQELGCRGPSRSASGSMRSKRARSERNPGSSAIPTTVSGTREEVKGTRRRSPADTEDAASRSPNRSRRRRSRGRSRCAGRRSASCRPARLPEDAREHAAARPVEASQHRGHVVSGRRPSMSRIAARISLRSGGLIRRARTRWWELRASAVQTTFGRKRSASASCSTTEMTSFIALAKSSCGGHAPV